VGEKVTTVRQTPLTEMLSPSWASERRTDPAGRVMVREVPPEESLWSRVVTSAGVVVKVVS
jgi:hypothetical protein